MHMLWMIFIDIHSHGIIDILANDIWVNDCSRLIGIGSIENEPSPLILKSS